MFRALMNLLFRQTVEHVVRDLSKAVQRLEDVAQRELADAEAKRDAADQLLAEASQHGEEHVRAKRVSAKIAELVA